MRGYSLKKDLRLLINNPKYSDVEILCEDKKKLFGCRAILAARSEVFDRLLYNGMKETYENQISFPNINSSGMEIILEYIYTGSINEESLTKDNTIEAFYAADYFQLPDLQDFIMIVFKSTMERNYRENYSPELLSKVAEIMPISEDNILLNLLVESVATIPLNTIEFGRLSIKALQYLLSCTYDKEKPFVTPEYEVFRYSAIVAAKQVSNDAYVTLMEILPTLEQIKESTEIENRIIVDRQKVSKQLEPLVKFIDFRRINAQILANTIEPLEIIPIETILSVYRHLALLNKLDLSNTRGKPQPIFDFDETACGSKLIIEDNCKVVQASNGCDRHQSVRSKMMLENGGVYEWDVIIEKHCGTVWVGVCATENFNYEKFAGHQPTGWVLGSNGNCYNSSYKLDYCPSFKNEGAKITVHLDMDKRTCAFTVNGTKYYVSGWNNLPSKLYPVVSLNYPGRFRIQPHQKNQHMIETLYR
ncbi:uncharacterized protein OCT59_001006 [Rhizophagus irregularis]|uniref:Btb/poz domain containing protein n=2 Tax=Rhizophagus irregularis TaxID=588596 RepID=A0A015JPR9_RHIIW|nr:hypothetical protein RirG_211100 [Rhizophagus irregularis DAOM 197198w]UZN99739.1 hypothetical protein OCT59_001006 [Rhizophagus irregularis]CAG8578535.1 17599_t:CDS:1 [Rhizophagus irregularis]